METIGDNFEKDELKSVVAKLFADYFSRRDKTVGMDADYWRMADISECVASILEYADLYGISVEMRNRAKWQNQTASAKEANDAGRA